MSHINTKSEISSRGGYQLSSREGSNTLILPYYVRCSLLVLSIAFGVGISFFSGHYYNPYKGIPSECQPNIDRESSLRP